MSQPQLARVSGVSIGLIRKIEQGQRGSARLDTIASLASALDVPMTDLLGVYPGFSGGRQDAAVATVRAAIYDRGDDHDPVPLQVLRQDQHDMHGLYWHARYVQLAEVVPGHLRAARTAVRAATGGQARRHANAVLAQGLKLAASLVTHLAHEDLAHVALLQARAAAEAAEDQLLIASHASTTAWVLSRQGLWRQAQALAAEAAKTVEPVFSEASPQQIAMWGQLLHFGMVALAREGRGDEAHELLSLVQAAGQAVGNRAGPRFLFSETFAAHSVVQLHQATGQPREALKAARRVDTPQVLPPSVQSRFLLNKAWALTLEWKSQEALDALREIDVLTPELLNHHGLARAVVEELMPRRKKQHLPGLVGIADRMGVTG